MSFWKGLMSMEDSQNYLASVIVRCVIIVLALFGALWIIYQVVMLSPGQIPSFEETSQISLPSFGEWLWGDGESQGVLRGDFGVSLTTSQPVSETIGTRIGATAELFLLALLFSLLLGLPFGVLMAAYRHTFIDIALRGVFLVASSAAVFWLGLFLIWQLGVQSEAFPTSGRCPIGLTEGCASIFERWEYVALPLLTLVIFWGSSTALSLRGMIVGFANRAPEMRFQGRFAGQGVLLYILVGIPYLAGGLLSSLILVEAIFAWSGIGRLVFDAVMRRDYPLLVGVAVSAVLFMAAVYLVTTLLYGLLAALTQEPASGYGYSLRSGEDAGQPSLWNTARNIIAVVAVVVFAVIALLVSMPSLVTDRAPAQMELTARFAEPGTEGYPLGADDLGRDHLARLLQGARTSLSIAFTATIIALVIGGISGLLAGAFDGALGLIFNLPLTYAGITLTLFPPLLLILLLSIITLPGNNLGLILGLIGWPLVGMNVSSWLRNLRQSASQGKKKKKRTLAVPSDEPFADETVTLEDTVEEAPASLVLSSDQIARNALLLLVFTAAMSMSTFLLAEASLSFLGAGVQPPEASLGNLLSNAQMALIQAPHLFILPGILLLVIMLCLQIIAMRANDAFEFRLTEVQ
jgi:ABC-type dipeptide/oligopeptide/nickel transport system permease component/ABC-type dipeptide/oligopeptide/nickel transport system permease subunit